MIKNISLYTQNKYIQNDKLNSILPCHSTRQRWKIAVEGLPHCDRFPGGVVAADPGDALHCTLWWHSWSAGAILSLTIPTHVVVEDTGGFHGALCHLWRHAENPPVEPPLVGEDAKGALHNPPGMGQPKIEAPPLSPQVLARVGPQEVPPQRKSLIPNEYMRLGSQMVCSR